MTPLQRVLRVALIAAVGGLQITLAYGLMRVMGVDAATSIRAAIAALALASLLVGIEMVRLKLQIRKVERRLELLRVEMKREAKIGRV